MVVGQQVQVDQGASCGQALERALSKKQFKNAALCRCGGALLDLGAPLPADCAELEPVFADSPEGLSTIRHSAAHVMAEAVKKLFPGAQVAIGPSIENGFYYDFDFERPFTPEDL
ncbi:MAG: threonine--tRNA ligase, partial [Desulfovibrionaceae bacterium]|nr:threonine--tRNA ligase [Desulfovibrionaceae bacterium]